LDIIYADLHKSLFILFNFFLNFSPWFILPRLMFGKIIFLDSETEFWISMRNRVLRIFFGLIGKNSRKSWSNPVRCGLIVIDRPFPTVNLIIFYDISQTCVLRNFLGLIWDKTAFTLPNFLFKFLILGVFK